MKSLKIYLNIYDFYPSTNSFASSLGLGTYHTGVQINNKQYCYTVISTNQQQSGVIVIDPESADYQFNKKIYIGQTKLPVQEYLSALEELSKQFTCGKYHVFWNNCNHFSQKLIHKLMKVDIPQWIFRATNIMKYTCCCLPIGFVTGKWGIEALQMQQPDDMEDGLTNLS